MVEAFEALSPRWCWPILSVKWARRRASSLIVGTSTGGILALGLSLQDQQGRSLLAAKRMVALYERHGPKIFERSLWRKLRTAGGLFEEAYSHEALEKILNQYFRDKRMGDCGTPVMVTSYDIERRKTVFLKS